MNGPGITVPLGKGKLPAMEISVNHDQVTRIQALTSEMSVLRDNYTALGSSKDAIDRRAIDLQRELEATRTRADAGTYCLKTLYISHFSHPSPSTHPIPFQYTLTTHPSPSTHTLNPFSPHTISHHLITHFTLSSCGSIVKTAKRTHHTKELVRRTCDQVRE